MLGGGGTASTEVLKQRCDRALGQILCSCFTRISHSNKSPLPASTLVLRLFRTWNSQFF